MALVVCLSARSAVLYDLVKINDLFNNGCVISDQKLEGWNPLLANCMIIIMTIRGINLLAHSIFFAVVFLKLWKRDIYGEIFNSCFSCVSSKYPRQSQIRRIVLFLLQKKYPTDSEILANVRKTFFLFCTLLMRKC